MPSIKIADKIIGFDQPTFIIAEAGVNHNGDLTIAKKMVDVVVDSGADAIKFQTFKTENLILQNAPKAKYQEDLKRPDEDFYKLLKRLELSFDAFIELKTYTEKKKIIFLSTPFDQESADFLEKIKVPAFKVSSTDFDNYFFLKYLIQKKIPIIISSGMADMDEVQNTMNFIKKERFNKLILLHCVSSYPALLDTLNLKSIQLFKKKFKDIPIGFSDHSTSLWTGALAVAAGACVIEKHFTLDQNMEGPDHKASLNPAQLKEYVQNIRQTEQILGKEEKVVNSIEVDIKKVARKSIVSRKDISAGTLLTLENLCIKRPGNGIPAKEFFNVIGRKVKKNIKAETIIEWVDLE